MRHRKRPAGMKRFPRPPRRPFNACFPILRPCVSKARAESRRRLTGNFPRRGNACECPAAPFCKPPLLSALRPSSPERRGRLSRFLSRHEKFFKAVPLFFPSAARRRQENGDRPRGCAAPECTASPQARAFLSVPQKDPLLFLQPTKNNGGRRGRAHALRRPARDSSPRSAPIRIPHTWGKRFDEPEKIDYNNR